MAMDGSEIFRRCGRMAREWFGGGIGEQQPAGSDEVSVEALKSPKKASPK